MKELTTNDWVKIEVDEISSGNRLHSGTEYVAESYDKRYYLWIPGFGKLS